MRDRGRRVELIAELVRRLAERAGPRRRRRRSRYRPRSRAKTPEELVAELAERVESDLERGFTRPRSSPRRPATLHARAASCARTAPRGSSGSALLALLLAEREAIAAAARRGAADAARRRDERARPRPPRGAGRVAATLGGQSVITTTDLEHVPGAGEHGVTRLAVARRHDAPGGGWRDPCTAAARAACRSRSIGRGTTLAPQTLLAERPAGLAGSGRGGDRRRGDARPRSAAGC